MTGLFDEAYFLSVSKGDLSCGKAMAFLRVPLSLDELPISITGLLMMRMIGMLLQGVSYKYEVWQK
jgi:hypothetical protein